MKGLVEETVKDLGKLDVMVNNAGASFRAKVEDISMNGWNTVVGINLNGVFFGCKWAGRQMMAQGGGVIINISSIAGVYGSTMMSHYGASKAAVINFTRDPRHGVGAQGHPGQLHRAGPGGDGGVPGRPPQDQSGRPRRSTTAVANRVGTRAAGARWRRSPTPASSSPPTPLGFMNGTTMVIDGGLPHSGRRGRIAPPGDLSQAGA